MRLRCSAQFVTQCAAFVFLCLWLPAETAVVQDLCLVEGNKIEICRGKWGLGLHILLDKWSELHRWISNFTARNLQILHQEIFTIIPEGLGMIAESSGLKARPEGAQRLKAGPEGLMDPRSCRGLKVWFEFIRTPRTVSFVCNKDEQHVWKLGNEQLQKVQLHNFKSLWPWAYEPGFVRASKWAAEDGDGSSYRRVPRLLFENRICYWSFPKPRSKAGICHRCHWNRRARSLHSSCPVCHRQGCTFHFSK